MVKFLRNNSNIFKQIKHIYLPDEEVDDFDENYDYNPFSYPPDLNLCLTHLKATKFSKLKNNKFSKCPCCGYIIDRKDYNMWENVDNFAIHGYCYPLYFKFMKFSIIFIFIFFLTNSWFYIHKYSKGNFCKNNNINYKTYNNKEIDNYFKKNYSLKMYMYWYCYSTLILNNSYCNQYFKNKCNNQESEYCYNIIWNMIKNYKNSYICINNFENNISISNSLGLNSNINYDSFEENLIKVINFLILLFSFIFWYFYENKIISEFEKNIITYSDFTIQINNLPKFLINKQLKEFKIKLKDFFEYTINHELSEKYNKKIDIVITNIELPYDYTYYEDLIQKHEYSKYKYKQNLINNNNNIELVRLNNSNYNNIKNNLKNYIKLKICNNLSGIAFISFYRKNNMSLILDNYSNNNYIFNILNKKNKLIFYDKTTKAEYDFKVSKAPQPNDLIWENLGYTKNQLIIRSMLSYIFIILLCFMYFTIVLWITFVNQFLINNKEDYNSNFLKILTSYIVIFLNEILKQIFYVIIDFEKKPTISERESSLALMLYKYQVFNSTIPLVLSAILRLNIFGEGGLINYVDSFLFANIYLPYVIEIVFDIFYLYKAYYRNKIKYNRKNCFIVQEDAN